MEEKYGTTLTSWYLAIIVDYFKGLFNSCRFGLLFGYVMSNAKLQKLCRKIIKHNIYLYFLPSMIVQLITFIFNISLQPVLRVINLPILIVSTFLHLLHYTDLVNIVSVYSSKTTKNVAALDLISLAITMTIYQLVMYMSTELINLILHDRLYWICVLLNFLILSMYHSFYYYNNLWHYKKINMEHRIDMHEKLWPYYFGYGTISTIIYLYTSNPYVMGFYNIYMAIVIAIPFLIDPLYPPPENSYWRINTSIFSYIISYLFSMVKYIGGEKK